MRTAPDTRDVPETGATGSTRVVTAASRHPCFDPRSRRWFGRVHLPVAPRCNVQCSYCDRRFACVNEARPGVTRKVMSPAEALEYVREVRRADPRVAVAGIAGPGDAFANPETTLDTLARLRSSEPDLVLCVATNGLRLGEHVDGLSKLGVRHVTVTVNAVDPAVGAKMYRYVVDEGRILRGAAAAALLCAEQFDAIRKLKERGITCKVNTVVVPGINDHHVPAVAAAVSKLGADLMNCLPLLPVANTPFAGMEGPSPAELAEVRQRAGAFLPQMTHCQRCRADAAGMLGDAPARGAHRDGAPRPHVAVASSDGASVDLHLGMARSVQIWRQDGAGFAVVGERDLPPAHVDDRWTRVAQVLADCRALLVAAAGRWPSVALAHGGTATVVAAGSVEDGLRRVYLGDRLADIEAAASVAGCRCDTSCSGDPSGCS